MRISPRGTPSTPATVLITVGKNTPNAKVTSFEPSPMPNQMMNSGTSAILGTGNNADTTAIPGDRARVNSPNATPTTSPATVPITQPIARRCNEAARCNQSSPLVPRSHRARPINTGEEAKDVDTHPNEAQPCHRVNSPISVAAPAQPT